MFDLGGGTFDLSLLQVDNRSVEVLANTGNDLLGGNDFDQRVLDWLAKVC